MSARGLSKLQRRILVTLAGNRKSAPWSESDGARAALTTRDIVDALFECTHDFRVECEVSTALCSPNAPSRRQRHFAVWRALDRLHTRELITGEYGHEDLGDRRIEITQVARSVAWSITDAGRAAIGIGISHDIPLVDASGVVR